MSSTVSIAWFMRRDAYPLRWWSGSVAKTASHQQSMVGYAYVSIWTTVKRRASVNFWKPLYDPSSISWAILWMVTDNSGARAALLKSYSIFEPLPCVVVNLLHHLIETQSPLRFPAWKSHQGGIRKRLFYSDSKINSRGKKVSPRRKPDSVRDDFVSFVRHNVRFSF